MRTLIFLLVSCWLSVCVAKSHDRFDDLIAQASDNVIMSVFREYSFDECLSDLELVYYIFYSETSHPSIEQIRNETMEIDQFINQVFTICSPDFNKVALIVEESANKKYVQQCHLFDPDSTPGERDTCFNELRLILGDLKIEIHDEVINELKNGEDSLEIKLEKRDVNQQSDSEILKEAHGIRYNKPEPRPDSGVSSVTRTEMQNLEMQKLKDKKQRKSEKQKSKEAKKQRERKRKLVRKERKQQQKLKKERDAQIKKDRQKLKKAKKNHITATIDTDGNLPPIHSSYDSLTTALSGYTLHWGHTPLPALFPPPRDDENFDEDAIQDDNSILSHTKEFEASFFPISNKDDDYDNEDDDCDLETELSPDEPGENYTKTLYKLRATTVTTTSISVTIIPTTTLKVVFIGTDTVYVPIKDYKTKTILDITTRTTLHPTTVTTTQTTKTREPTTTTTTTTKKLKKTITEIEKCTETVTDYEVETYWETIYKTTTVPTTTTSISLSTTIVTTTAQNAVSKACAILGLLGVQCPQLNIQAVATSNETGIPLMPVARMTKLAFSDGALMLGGAPPPRLETVTATAETTPKKSQFAINTVVHLLSSPTAAISTHSKATSFLPLSFFSLSSPHSIFRIEKIMNNHTNTFIQFSGHTYDSGIDPSMTRLAHCGTSFLVILMLTFFVFV